MIRTKTPTSLSVSGCQAFQQCQLKYYWRYLRKIPFIENIKMCIGKAVHEGMAFYHKAHGEVMETDIVDCMNLAVDGYNLSDNEKDEVIRTSSKLIPKIIKKVKDFKPMLVEYPIELQLDEEFKIVGVVDLVTEDGTIYDYKVSSRHKSVNDHIFQLGVYGYLVNRGACNGGIISVRTDGDVKVMVEPLDPVKAYHALLSNWNAIQLCLTNNVFAPTYIGWHCSEEFCDAWNYCKYGSGNDYTDTYTDLEYTEVVTND